MANVEVVARNFSGSFASKNGMNPMRVSFRAFLRASLTLGFQSGSDFRMGNWRDWRFAFYRLCLANSSWYLLEKRSGNLCLSGGHRRFDSSEKAIMSYWHGMVFAKLIAEDRLKIPWLAHVDDMLKNGALTTTATTKKRGDLVGRAKTGDWHVIEAKGRTRPFKNKLINDAKAQAAYVTTVGSGCIPQTNSACISSLWRNPIRIILDDPPSEGGDQNVTWKFDDAAFWNYYYGNLAAYIRTFGSEGKVDGLSGYRTAPLTPQFFIPFAPRLWVEDLRIGLPEKIVESALAAPRALQEQTREPADYIASDGIALIGKLPDWVEADRQSPIVDEGVD
jgi:hypothetical protein